MILWNEVLTNSAPRNRSEVGAGPDRTQLRAEQAALDLKLVSRVLAGDEGALGELGARLQCVPAILAAVNRRSHSPLNRSQLADLSQDTVLKIWGKLGIFRGDSTFEGWAYRFGVLEMKNAVRRLSRERDILQSSTIEMSSYPSAEEPADPVLDESKLEEALESISEPMATVIRLKHGEGLLFREVGDRLAISENTARSRYYRGISRLRTLLGQDSRPKHGQDQL